MSNSGLFSRTTAVARASFFTLRRNPRLLWFPVLSLLAQAGLVGLFVLAAIARGGVDPQTVVEIHAGLVSGVLATLGLHLVAIYLGVAMSHSALEALAVREWTVSGGFARARARRGAIAGYAALGVLSRVVLSRRRRRRGKGKRRRRRRDGLLQRLARGAWWAATYLALPVLAREDRGPVDSVTRSATLFRETWREGVFARWAISWLWVPGVVLSCAPVAACALIGGERPLLWLAAITASVMGLLFTGVVVSALDVVYRAALYVFATEGVVPAAFDIPDLHGIWETTARDADGTDPAA